MGSLEFPFSNHAHKTAGVVLYFENIAICKLIDAVQACLHKFSLLISRTISHLLEIQAVSIPRAERAVRGMGEGDWVSWAF